MAKSPRKFTLPLSVAAELDKLARYVHAEAGGLVRGNSGGPPIGYAASQAIHEAWGRSARTSTAPPIPLDERTRQKSLRITPEAADLLDRLEAELRRRHNWPGRESLSRALAWAIHDAYWRRARPGNGQVEVKEAATPSEKG